MIWPLLLLPLIPTFFRFLVACHVSLINLRSADDYAILPFSPTDLSVADVVLVVCLFVGRSIKKALGYGQATGFKASPNQQKHNTSPSRAPVDQQTDGNGLVHLRRLELAMPLHIRSPDLAQYVKTISSTSSAGSSSSKATTIGKLTTDILISNLSHLTLFLSAISEPALLLLLARKGCPVEPLGSVNARNHFELLRPDLCKQIIKEAELTPAKTQTTTAKHDTSSHNLENSVLAFLPPSARHVKRGTEIDITVSIYTRVKDAQSQTWGPNIEVFRQIFTVLQFSSPSSSSSSTTTTTKPPIASNTTAIPPTLTETPPSTLLNPPTLASYIPLQKSDPLEWASLCKDYNPIHISPLAARAFGFKGVIAHGNHVVAKALTTFTGIDSLLSSSMSFLNRNNDDDNDLHESEDTMGEGGERGIYMDVSFKRPVLVPSEMGVRCVERERNDQEENDSADIEVFKVEKTYIEIRMGRLNIAV